MEEEFPNQKWLKLLRYFGHENINIPNPRNRVNPFLAVAVLNSNMLSICGLRNFGDRECH